MNATSRLVTLLVAVSWVVGCASTPSNSSSSSPPLPMPTSSPSPMPSLPSPSTSPSSRPSMPSPSAPSSSRSSSSSSGNPGQTGAPTAGATPGTTASQPGDAQASAPTPTGGQNDLEVLEPDPLEDLADADPTWDEGDSAAGSEGAAGAAGGGASGGAEGGAQPAGAQAGGPAGEPGAEGDVEVVVSAEVPSDGGGLDQQLNRSLEVFDLEMQRTITILASARGGEGESGGGMDAPSGEAGDPADQTGGGSELILVDGDPSLLPGGENSGEPVDGEGGTQVARAGNRSGMRGGSSRNEAYPRIPPDVGDGSDDDVVARQIREAALNESDPVLREKLWQEYRNYKKSIK